MVLVNQPDIVVVDKEQKDLRHLSPQKSISRKSEDDAKNPQVEEKPPTEGERMTYMCVCELQVQGRIV